MDTIIQESDYTLFLFQRYFFSFRVSFQSSLRTLYFGRTFPASEYLQSASRTLERLFNDAFFLAVLFPLPSIFSALLEDSSFWSYFPHFRVSAQGPRGLFDDAFFFSSTFPASEYLRSALEDSWRTLYFGRTFPAISSTCAASSNFYDLRLSRVLAQRV